MRRWDEMSTHACRCNGSQPPRDEKVVIDYYALLHWYYPMAYLSDFQCLLIYTHNKTSTQKWSVSMIMDPIWMITINAKLSTFSLGFWISMFILFYQMLSIYVTHVNVVDIQDKFKKLLVGYNQLLDIHCLISWLQCSASLHCIFTPHVVLL